MKGEPSKVSRLKVIVNSPAFELAKGMASVESETMPPAPES